MRMNFRFLAAGVILSGPWLAVPANAQALNDRFWIQATAYYPKIDTDVTLSTVANPNIGTHIDLEEDLGLDDREILPAIFAGGRLGSNFSIGAEYYSLHRDTTGTLNRDITVEDVVYPVNATITAGFDTDVYRLTVGYAFIRRPNYEFGAAIGLHATDFAFTIEGSGSVNGQPATIQQRRHSVLAPLPTIGLFGTYEIAPGFTIGARFDWLSLSIGDYKGRLLNTQATLQYRVWRNVGIGLMYRYVHYRVDADKETFTGRFAYSFSGPAIFLEVGF